MPAKLNNGQTIDHGLGFGMTPFRGHKRVGHSGGAAGFSTAISRFPDDKVTVIILSNSDGHGYKDQEGFLISKTADEIAALYFAR
ncbi:MAG: serine hydrolase [Pyrinomonadaceae bacterium]